MQEQPEAAGACAPGGAAGENAEGNGEHHAGDDGDEPPEGGVVDAPDERTPDEADQRYGPNDGGWPRARQCRPQSAFAGPSARPCPSRMVATKLEVPEHLQRRVQATRRPFRPGR